MDCCCVKLLPGHCLDSPFQANWLENIVQLCQYLSLIQCPGGLTEEILSLEKIIIMMSKFTRIGGLAPLDSLPVVFGDLTLLELVLPEKPVSWCYPP